MEKLQLHMLWHKTHTCFSPLFERSTWYFCSYELLCRSVELFFSDSLSRRCIFIYQTSVTWYILKPPWYKYFLFGIYKIWHISIIFYSYQFVWYTQNIKLLIKQKLPQIHLKNEYAQCNCCLSSTPEVVASKEGDRIVKFLKCWQ